MCECVNVLTPRRVRFAPPLVIEEADLLKAVRIIGECLVDLERLDEVPGEKGHVDSI